MKTEKRFTEQELTALRALISEQTGYTVRGDSLLTQIFTRSSYSAEHGGQDNEILEFIGDQVLSYYVVKIVSEKCGAFNSAHEYASLMHEGRFTIIKQELVSNDALAEIIDGWDCARYLIVNGGDYTNAVDQRTKVKADLFESILGAIAVESGFCPAALERAVRQTIFTPEKVNTLLDPARRVPQLDIEFDRDTAVSALQELRDRDICSQQDYDYEGPEQSGYDENAYPLWTCTCTAVFSGASFTRQVRASSKKGAKKYAAYLILCAYFNRRNMYGPDAEQSRWEYKDGRLTPL